MENSTLGSGPPTHPSASVENHNQFPLFISKFDPSVEFSTLFSILNTSLNIIYCDSSLAANSCFQDILLQSKLLEVYPNQILPFLLDTLTGDFQHNLEDTCS